jgi:tRNA pseudouridine32 synthase/23S rRNA pseudouridine746 synthase
MASKFHCFDNDISGIDLPLQFTYPFYYKPHPLCVMASEQVRRYISTHSDWTDELAAGKMIGVLVTRKNDGEIGFLAAFSGNLAGSNMHEYFVPSVYDLLNPDGFFRKGEAEITAMNAEIRNIENDVEYHKAKERLQSAVTEAEASIKEFKNLMAKSKARRHEVRDSGFADEANLAELIAESRFQQAELKRLRTNRQRRIDEEKAKIDYFTNRIKFLQSSRKEKSAELQMRMFRHFEMLNAKGEKCDLCHIFADTPQGVPPAGAGECAAPKLLQYAFKNNLKPIAMAEFWVGESPQGEMRREGNFYPACQSKCGPILTFMLQGLDVEPNPLLKIRLHDDDIEVLYEDEWLLVVNKPAGMLTVPGKLDADSLIQRLQRRFPEVNELMIVHRLDMATSGLLIIAKTKEVHRSLQSQFVSRRVTKRYVALLDGKVKDSEGLIKLPICVNPDDRPRQIVNYEHGRTAFTRYEVIERNVKIDDAEGREVTRVNFFPITGRTHQLRVHAAHHLGLDAPILGDALYGQPASRLYLHAEFISFVHPVTWATIKVEKKADF